MTTKPETFTEYCSHDSCAGFEVAWDDFGENAKWVRTLIAVITNEFGTTTDVCEVCEDTMKGSGEYNEFNNW